MASNISTISACSEKPGRLMGRSLFRRCKRTRCNKHKDALVKLSHPTTNLLKIDILIGPATSRPVEETPRSVTKYLDDNDRCFLHSPALLGNLRLPLSKTNITFSRGGG